jgi:hypothetical protein
MFSFDLVRVATAAVGALVLSTSFVAAAVGPAATASTDATRSAYVQVHIPGSGSGAGHANG